MKFNSPETLMRLTVEQMEVVATAADAHWANLGQDGFEITNPKLMTPLVFLLLTAIGYGFVADLGMAFPWFRSTFLFCGLGFFAMFCMVAGQLAWRHLSRGSLIKKARDMGVDVTTLGEPALARWVIQPLREQQRVGVSAE